MWLLVLNSDDRYTFLPQIRGKIGYPTAVEAQKSKVRYEKVM